MCIYPLRKEVFRKREYYLNILALTKKSSVYYGNLLWKAVKESIVSTLKGGIQRYNLMSDDEIFT